MGSAAMLWQGLRFGMLLQLAVGPVCLMVLNAAGTLGFLPTMPLVASVTLVDAFYILLASLGIGAVMDKPKVKAGMKTVGGLVLILFGADMGLGVLGITLIPGFRLFSASADANLFLQGLILTLSNPMTILFWGGMFTAKGAENRWNRRQLGVFAVGCVLSTALFLSAVAGLGSCFTGRVPSVVIQGLNIAVGAALVFFGVRLILKKEN